MNEGWHDNAEAMRDLEEGYWRSLLADGEIASSSRRGSDGPWAKKFEGRERYVDGGQTDTHSEDWDAAERARTCMEVLNLPIVGYNRGGLLVQFKRLCGFVPASHLVDLPRLPDPEERRRALAQRVGQTLKVCIIEVDRTQGRLVMSQRAIHEGQRGQELWRCLKAGEIRRGRVTNLRPFGAFVDLGGVEGLLHVSELSWGRVEHPSEVVHPGDEIDVYVMSVDPTQRRIALSLKRLLPDPWATVQERYQVGQIVTGVVTNVVSFGAFVRVEEGLEGLVHISELAEGQFLHPRNVVQEGDVVRARILNIDPSNRRMGLSLRRIVMPPQTVETSSARRMSSSEGKSAGQEPIGVRDGER
ncbi:MAG: S1 RNA-binding domain-containing protein [Anaerolineae bacterium]|nr:S1 RNA-binding domain-containing protein [Anaerolineae bacterium]MDW8100329.1 S1 RNA-binding domain-containing protein [Anaerolineae bacterium]